MDLKRLMQALGIDALIPQELPGIAPVRQIGFGGVPRGGWPIRPGSRSKYRPHTAQSGSREAVRRRRQMDKGMLKASPADLYQNKPVIHKDERKPWNKMTEFQMAG